MWVGFFFLPLLIGVLETSVLGVMDDNFPQGEPVTYEKIFKLKFEDDVPTHELEKRFPNELKKISKIALMELPPSTLKELLKREHELKKLLTLKQSLLRKIRKK